MGCSYCNRSSETTNHDGVESIEKDLQLSEIPSIVLVGIFQKYSSENSMTLTQFQKALRELHIDFDKYFLFYNFFKDQNLIKFNVISYKPQKLSTLGILLGSCHERDKLALLFKNYDQNGYKKLSRSDIECLVTDVLEICILYIPKYAYLVLNHPAIKRYAETLEGEFELIKTYFVNAILGTFPRITLNVFLNIFDDKNTLAIIRSQQLREVS